MLRFRMFGAEIPELFYASDFELDSVESNRFVAREQKSSYWRRERLGFVFRFLVMECNRLIV